MDYRDAGLLVKAIQEGVITGNKLKTLGKDWSRGAKDQSLFDYLLIRGVLTSEQVKGVRIAVQAEGVACPSCQIRVPTPDDPFDPMGKWDCIGCGENLLNLGIGSADTEGASGIIDMSASASSLDMKMTDPASVPFTRLDGSAVDPFVGMSLESCTVGKFEDAPRENVRTYVGNSSSGEATEITCVQLTGPLSQWLLQRVEKAREIDSKAFLPILEVGKGRDFFYLVTPPKTGETLTETVRKNGPLRPDATLHLLDILARGLGKAHQGDLVHLFLTPDSIRISDVGPVVVDLALPANVGGLELFGFPNGFIGDLRTAAPERFDLKPISPSSDIYSLGLIFSFTLTGKLPILDKEPTHAWVANVTEDVPNPRVTRPDLPESMVKLLEKMTARDPRGRYQGMFDILDDIELIRGGKSPAAIPPHAEAIPPRPDVDSIVLPEDKPKGSNTLVFVNAFLGLIVLLLLYLVLQNSPDKDFFKNLPINIPAKATSAK